MGCEVSEAPKRSEPSVWEQIGRYLGLAFTLPIAVMLGYAAGEWLDRHFHSGSLWQIVGLFLGGAAGLIEIIRVASRDRG